MKTNEIKLVKPVKIKINNEVEYDVCAILYATPKAKGEEEIVVEILQSNESLYLYRCVGYLSDGDIYIDAIKNAVKDYDYRTRNTITQRLEDWDGIIEIKE